MGLRVVFAVLLGAAAGLGCASTGGANGASNPSGSGVRGTARVGEPAPDLRINKLNGGAISLSSLRGQVVLLDVWASWCVPCRQELPMLDDIAARLKDQGVEVLAVSIDQDRQNVKKFLESRSRWALTVAHDPLGAVADTLQPEKMPTSYLIDRQGIVRYINAGFEPHDAKRIERQLRQLAAAR